MKIFAKKEEENRKDGEIKLARYIYFCEIHFLRDKKTIIARKTQKDQIIYDEK